MIDAQSNPGEKHSDGWDTGLKKTLLKIKNQKL